MVIVLCKLFMRSLISEIMLEDEVQNSFPTEVKKESQ